MTQFAVLPISTVNYKAGYVLTSAICSEKARIIKADSHFGI